MSSPGSQWNDVERSFFEVLELAPSERERRLDEIASTNQPVAHEVRALLDAHEGVSALETAPRVGAYRLERLLGRGGMGEVWLASRADGEFEQRVALKLLRPGIGLDVMLDRFRQERQLLARLVHPHIARLYDGGIASDSRPYFAMEYVEGEQILEHAEHRDLDVPSRLRLFQKLCSAIEYAHHNLIVHRDIKPGNVLVTAEGAPKLLDFGIAKLMEGEGDVTATALPMLTPRYASPEQVRGEPATTASDVYSLGVVLYELLTGSLPYDLKGRTVPEVITAISTQEPRPASEVKRDGVRVLPKSDLDYILAKALEKDPARRYASVEQFSADIEHYLEGWPVSARRGSTGYRVRKFVRRHWAAVGAAAVVIVSLATASLVSVRQARLANAQKERTERVALFLKSILQSGDTSIGGTGGGKGSDTKIADVLDSAGRRIAADFANDPAMQAELRESLCRSYISIGLADKARAEIDSAMAGFQYISDNPLLKAKIIDASAMLDYYSGHIESAEQKGRQVESIFDASPSARRDVPAHALTLSNLSMYMAGRGQLNEAAQVLNRAVRILEAMPSAPVLEAGFFQSNLAYINLTMGNLEKVRQEGYGAIQKLSSVPHPPVDLSYAETNVGLAERYLGNPSAAMTAFEKAVAAARPAGEDHPITLAPRMELALQRALGGEIGPAEKELERCLALAKKYSQAREVVRGTQELGYVRSLAGRPREGEPLLREALQDRLREMPSGSYRTATAESMLAECLEREGRSAEAIPLYRKALESLTKSFGANVYITQSVQDHLRKLGGL